MKRNRPKPLAIPFLLRILVFVAVFGFAGSISSVYGQHCKMLIFIYPDICNTGDIVLHAFPWPTMVQPITYQWSTGETTQDITVPNAAGTYIVTVSDAAGCAVSTSLVISDPAVFDFFIEMYNGCPGEDIFLTVEWNQLEAPVNAEYLWSTGETTEIIATTTPGLYSVTITDPATGCSTVRSRDVQFFPGVYPVITGPTSLCNATSITLNVTGGPFLGYFWDPFVGDSETVTVTEPGTYTVTVHNEYSCFGTATIDITNGSEDPVIGGTTTLCSGGQGMLDVVNANQFSSFLWNTGEVSPGIAITSPGIYSVTVSDGGGCSSSQSFTVANNTVPPVPTTVTTPATCGNDNGSVNLSVTPSGAYTYIWSNGATTEDLTSVPPGNYMVTITSTTSGCTATASAVVGSIPVVLNVTGSVTQPSGGMNNGAIDVSVSPAGTYTYTWSNGATTQDLTGLGPGTYSVTVSGGGSCIEVATFVLSQPTCAGFTAGISDPGGSFCIGETLLLTCFPNGGTPPYSYTWSTGGSGQTESILIMSNIDVTVTVFDANDCMATGMIHLKPLIWQETIVVGPSVCEGQFVTLEVDPAQFWHEFLWSTGATTPVIQVNIPGTYNVTITDPGSGCSKVLTATPAFLPGIGAGITGPATLCSGQTATLNATGGPFTNYLWSPGGQTSPTITVNGPGIYGLTVENGTGCSGFDEIIIAPGQATPPALSGTAMICAGQTANIQVTNSSSYTNFLWSNGETSSLILVNTPGLYTVTVTNVSGCTATGNFTVANNPNGPNAVANAVAATCGQSNGGVNVAVVPFGVYTYNWSNGATTQDIFNVPSGNYAVTVTAANGCATNTTAIVPENSISISIVGNTTPVTSCSGSNGEVNITPSPAGNYTYIWSNGSTDQDLVDVPASTYTVTVSAGGSCVATASFEVSSTVAVPVISGSPAPVTSCSLANGGVDLTITPPGTYTFLWTDGSTLEDLQNVAGGNYGVTVTGANGCISTGNYTITNLPGNPTALPSATPATCGQSNGAVNLSVTPASGNTYLWSNGTTNEDLQDIPSGTYTVMIVGANGCTANASATVPENNIAFSLAAAITANTSCAGFNGSIDLSISQPDNYTFLWSNGATTEDLQNLNPGNYSVVVILGLTCLDSMNYVIPDSAFAPVLSSVVSPALCGQNTGAIQLSIVPSNGNTFLWSTGATDEDLQDIGPGTYAVTCTGSNGCVAVDTLEVLNSNSNFVVSAAAIANTSCNVANGGIDLTITPPGTYSFLWSTGATSEDLQGLATGSYSVTVNDASGCSDVQAMEIGGPILPQVTIGTPAVVCEGETAVLSADSGFVTYQWSGGQITDTIHVSQAGTYMVTATDANGCTATASQIFANMPLPTPVINGLDFICGGSTDFLVSGGSFPHMIWSTGDTTASISVFQPGTYIVTVTDANGCESSANHDLAVGTAPAPVIVGSTTACDGTAALNAGAGFTSYIWSNGVTGQEVIVNADGIYTVTVADMNGCIGGDTISIAIPTPPQVTITGNNLICTGDSTIFSIPDIFPQMLWSTGETAPEISVTEGGIYLVTVVDANGCTTSDEVILTVYPSPLPGISTAPTNCDGTAILNAEPGFVTYLWSNGATGPQLTVNADGNYTVAVTDLNGCMGIVSENVVIPALPQVQIAGTTQLCEGDETMLAAPGNYSQYLWSTGEMAPEITITQGSVYSVTVIDANGCTASDELTVTQLQTSYTGIEVTSCSVQDTGTVSTLMSNLFGCDSLVVTHTVLALPAFTEVQLSACPGESAVFNGVSIFAGGNQAFVFTAVNGCDSIVAVSVAAFPAMDFSLSSTETCWNTANGTIQVSALSGAPPYHYTLNGVAFQTAPTFTDLSGGNYTVEAEDANGCVFSQDIEVPQTTPTQVITENVILSCEEGLATIRPTVFASQPEALIWEWPDGSDNPWLQVAEPGVYHVLIDDGCEVLDRAIEVVWEALARKKELFYVPNSFSPNDDGINDVFRVFPGKDFEVLSFEFRIFDRWGDAMYMTTTVDGGWDGVFRGVEMQPAVYVWFVKAKVQLCGGRILDVFRKGDVTIVR